MNTIVLGLGEIVLYVGKSSFKWEQLCFIHKIHNGEQGLI